MSIDLPFILGMPFVHPNYILMNNILNSMNPRPPTTTSSNQRRSFSENAREVRININ